MKFGRKHLKHKARPKKVKHSKVKHVKIKHNKIKHLKHKKVMIKHHKIKHAKVKHAKIKKIIKIKPVIKKGEMKRIRERIEEKLKGNMPKEVMLKLDEAKIHRKKMEKAAKIKKSEKEPSIWLKTGIPGFDELMEKGIPKGASVLIAGGPGTGKTIFSLQMAMEAAKMGEKCYYISFEETVDRLKQHMRDFGFDPDEAEAKGLLKIKRVNPFDVTRSVEAMLEESKGELLIDVAPIDMPKGFKPDRVIIDSLSAIASAFMGKDESYRIYIEHLFRYFQEYGATIFMITEIVDLAKSLTEEFMADGVIVLYYIKHGTVRERAIEILKLRGAKHEEKIVAFQITEKGITVYPNQEVFGEIQ